MADVVVSTREVRVYRRRWLVLALNFSVFLVCCLPWMQYVIVSDVMTQYYGVSSQMVEWTSLVFNATAIIFTFPAAWFLNKYGLRPSFLVAAVGAVVGQWVKVLGSWPDRFWLILLGQAIGSVSVNFILSTPPRLAAVWFPAEQLSLAVGSGLLGQVGGVSIGCALAPMSINGNWTSEENFSGLFTIHLSMAGAATFVLLVSLCLFTNAPPLPPSPAQAAAAEAAAGSSFLQSMKRICRDPHFNLLVVGYTINTSVCLAVVTLLNRALVEFFPDRGAEAGLLAMLMTLSGLVGMIVTSIVLDKTKAFKEVVVLVYLGGALGVGGFTAALVFSTMEVVYVASAIAGFFMTSFFVPGYEMGAELTYPEPEGNPTAILNFIYQPIAMLVTLSTSSIFTSYGATAGNSFMCALLVVGLVAVSFIPKLYRRRDAELALRCEKQRGERTPLRHPEPHTETAPWPQQD